jgi:hypothetical protein
MPYPISDIASNFALYNKVYGRGTVLHDKTANTIRVADGITAYNDLLITRGRVEVTPVNANLVYAGPGSGATPANPVFRAIVPLDLGASTGASKVLTRDGSGGMDWQTPATPSATISVGTTPVTSGTVGRVFFEGTGNVVQQHSGFNYDTATGSQIIGGATARATRQTLINAADTLASKTLVVRNAADSADRFSVNGNGSWSLIGASGNVLHAFDSGSFGSGYLIGSSSTFSGVNSFLNISAGNIYMMLSSTLSGYLFTQSGGGGFVTQGNQAGYLYFAQATSWGTWKMGVGKGNMFLSTSFGFTWGGGERGVFAIENGVEPASNTTNAIQIFSKNITNASFHVMDSNSRIFYAGEKTGMRSNHNLQLAANDTVYLTISTAGLVTVADASNIAVGTTTGTKIGTATSQKISFWNKTPIVQPTTSITAATFAANTSGIVDDTATYGGYTMGQIAAALINTGILA